MTINTKYNIGDKVYVVFKETKKAEIVVYVGTIQEILFTNKGTSYYIDKIYEELTEDNLIFINDKEGLVKKIDELSKEAKNE